MNIMTEKETTPAETVPTDPTPAAAAPLPAPVEDPKIDDKVKEAKDLVEGMKRENDRKEALIIEERRLRVADVLGGETEVTQKKSKEEEGMEEAQKLVNKDLLDLSKKE